MYWVRLMSGCAPQMRESLISEQHSRQEEQETNAQMLRELQALIATERDHKKALNVEVSPSPTNFTHAHTLQSSHSWKSSTENCIMSESKSPEKSKPPPHFVWTSPTIYLQGARVRGTDTIHISGARASQRSTSGGREETRPLSSDTQTKARDGSNQSIL